jgi:hypothetical protein
MIYRVLPTSVLAGLRGDSGELVGPLGESRPPWLAIGVHSQTGWPVSFPMEDA